MYSDTVDRLTAERDEARAAAAGAGAVLAALIAVERTMKVKVHSPEVFEAMVRAEQRVRAALEARQDAPEPDAPQLHDADCPMTNSRPEARTTCICDGLVAGGRDAIRDTPEGGLR